MRPVTNEQQQERRRACVERGAAEAKRSPVALCYVVREDVRLPASTQTSWTRCPRCAPSPCIRRS